MVWMTAAEALDVLNVRPQTLYANVSRGKIRAKPDGDDPRRSLYHRDDVLRMARRANGRRKVEIVSSEAMQYGDPVLASAISTAANGKLLYRGHDAARLADTASLEDIAALLWQCDAAEGASLWPALASPRAGDLHHDEERAAAGDESALAAGLLTLARRSAIDAPSLGRTPTDLRAEAAGVLAALVDAMTAGGAAKPAGDDTVTAGGAAKPAGDDTVAAGGAAKPAGDDTVAAGGAAKPEGDDTVAAGGEVADEAVEAGVVSRLAVAGGRGVPASISSRLARHWRAEAHEDLIRRALVLMADNELNASTFATRVAISTGASLAAGVLAGLTTLTGPLHGGAAREFAQLIAATQASNAGQAVRHWLASGRPLPAFGHPLYSEGDPRAKALLRRLPNIQPYEDLANAAEQQAGELPNIDYALSLLTAHCGLPQEAPFVLFAVGRCVGWLAHALEQVQASRLIRPRARYTGPAEIVNAGIY